MTHAEATALVTTLSLAFPLDRFSADNAAVYERAIADLEAGETQLAVESLILTNKRMPVVAELRAEVMRARAARNTTPKPWLSKPTDYVSMADRQVWADTLGRMLEAKARHERMANAWYRERGLTPPAAPGFDYIAAAKRGAEGNPKPFDVKGFTG